MNKKLQVFVSSTYTDLIEERQAAVEAILDAGHIPAGMELFKAGKSQMKTIQKWIDESDVYMLILGGRYGSIEEESGLSYTELEYRYALSKNMPVFAIVLNDSFLFTKAAFKGKDAIFEKDNIKKYNSFKKFVETKIVKFADNADQIPSAIHSQLNHILTSDEYTLIGWIRDNIESKNVYSVSPQRIGKYSYLDLIDIFNHKKFDDTTALNIFIENYKRFCTGIVLLEDIIGSFNRANPDFYLSQEICPYFMSFGLIYFSSQKQIYRITEDGSYFYSLLLSNQLV